jgi:hypothetical protein
MLVVAFVTEVEIGGWRVVWGQVKRVVGRM